MTTPVLPNVEALVVGFLRADDAVKAIAGARGYTATLPKDPTRPCYRVTRFGGSPAVAFPLVLDRADLQIDTWGTTHGQAHDLMATIRAALADRLPGAHAAGAVTRVEFGPASNSPDITHDPAWPRYIADVSVFYRA